MISNPISNQGSQWRGKLKIDILKCVELTVYYGLAIRRNGNSVEKIKKAIQSTMFHKSSTDEEPNHDKCPPGQESCCSWQRAKATESLKNYKHRPPLHSDVVDAIPPIYESLTEKNIAEKLRWIHAEFERQFDQCDLADCSESPSQWCSYC
ncbi:hypothetical protein J437_LFUL018156 [Ladona fulva]|uniref:Uncharacterized protein n=1 Tax=Ladona fulva TaxID=123851 RepID=A0A8K0KUY5_LADFU|nr:hypothetical protein J437_LFUL018156 [Ladona fulva]